MQKHCSHLQTIQLSSKYLRHGHSTYGMYRSFMEQHVLKKMKYFVKKYPYCDKSIILKRFIQHLLWTQISFFKKYKIINSHYFTNWKPSLQSPFQSKPYWQQSSSLSSISNTKPSFLARENVESHVVLM